MYNFQCPAIESSYSIFENFIKDYPENIKEECYKFWSQGYITFMLDDIDFEGIKSQIEDHINSNKVVAQSSVYQYNDSPRVFEAWKWCKPVLDLARHPKILRMLKYLYGRDPIPFQTINFKKGSDQPLHSDTIHFHTVPERWMVGAWVALEDMDENNGTLQFVPGSHKLPAYDLQDIGREKSIYVAEKGFSEYKEREDQRHEENYRAYEEFIRDLTRAAYKKKLICPKGTVLLWAASLIHGGTPTIDKTRTRWSQAIHFYFPNCEKYYSPLYSNKTRGEYAEKDLNNKDILNHVI